MCGRFTLVSDLAAVIDQFQIGEVACNYAKKGQAFPGDEVYAVVHQGINRLVQLRWGLIPFWAKDPQIGRKMFNARAETITSKPSFRHAFRARRCLVLADGFYEWEKNKGRKTPVLFELKGGRIMGLAGLYDHWESPEGETIRSCTIITTEPSEIVRPVHNRMPVIIAEGDHGLWLDSRSAESSLLALLKPLAGGDLILRHLEREP